MAVKFKGFILKLTIAEPEEAEIFLRGCIMASQNNNSHLWREIIDGVNSGMEKYRAEQLKETMDARAAAGMP
jgi:hypothetical protein